MDSIGRQSGQIFKEIPMNSGLSFWETMQPWLIGLGIVLPSASALCLSIVLVFVYGRRRTWIKAALVVAWIGIVVSICGASAVMAPDTVQRWILDRTAMILHHRGIDSFAVAHFVTDWKQFALLSGASALLALVLINRKVRRVLRKRLLNQNRCQNCGYSTVGLSTGTVCPECGKLPSCHSE
jgi:hypothetical protein